MRVLALILALAGMAMFMIGGISFTRDRTVAEFGPRVCSVREMELLASVGVPPVDVIRAATLHAAIWLNREEEAGNP